jgi:hypothetical protein
MQAIGEGNVTEKWILDRVGDSRYTREILRRLLAQKVVVRLSLSLSLSLSHSHSLSLSLALSFSLSRTLFLSLAFSLLEEEEEAREGLRNASD